MADDRTKAQIAYCRRNGWAVNIGFTDDPHPRNTRWEVWGRPMFDLKEPAAFMHEPAGCRRSTAAAPASAFPASTPRRGGKACACPSSPTELRRGLGLSAGQPAPRVSLTGNPGAGKATAAFRQRALRPRRAWLRQAVRPFERRGQGAITAENVMTIVPEETPPGRVRAGRAPERAA